MWTRRDFLRNGTALAVVDASRVSPQTPDEAARDERFWGDVRRAFVLDRSLINLNNGAVSPSPRRVLDALKRDLDVSNLAPSHHMWDTLEPQLEDVRRALAAEVGVDPECLAVTRNASEALQIAQLGLDLDRGAEIVTTNQDYPRMLTTWDQRVRRDGVRVTKLSLPVPATSAEVVDRFARAITPATRVLHFCHVVNLTGQILPVRELCALARSRGVVSIVDGAQAFAQFPFRIPDFDPDYYGTSLHKWLLAPIGTGMLYVRRDRIERHWPLQPSPPSRSIRKFEEIGTHPAANHNAVGEALAFHHLIGAERKAARLRYLKDRWARRFAGRPRFVLRTSLASNESCALGTVGLEGLDAAKITARLWANRRILTAAILHPECEGVRVSPNVYTTLDEIDRFADAMERLARAAT